MNFASFDLNLLRVLDALLREGSTVRAATRLGLSQPAVSAALGRLRHALDDPLFHRQGNHLEATDFAVSLTLPIRDALESLESLLDGPKPFEPETAEATFRLSGSDFFAEMLMPGLAADLAARAPGIRVQLVDLVPDSYVDTLDRYEVDLALIPQTSYPDWVDHRPLFWSAFAAIARVGHPALARAQVAPGGVIPLDLFCELGHVLFSPEGRLEAMGDAALAKVGRSRRVAMTLPVFSGVYRAVASSELIALIPVQLAHAVAEKAGISVYAAPMDISPPRIDMVWHRRSTRSPAHRWIREQIVAAMEPIGDPAMPLV